MTTRTDREAELRAKFLEWAELSDDERLQRGLDGMTIVNTPDDIDPNWPAEVQAEMAQRFELLEVRDRPASWFGRT